MPATLKTTAFSMANGSNYSAGVGQISTVTVTGSWVLDDTLALVLTTPANSITQILGNGSLTNANPYRALTYKKKVYLTGDETTLFFSGIDQTTVFNVTPNIGNGFMDLSSEYGFSDDVLGAAIYQGKLAVFARRSIQVVAVDPDPANYSVPQTLENIGTVNGDSVRSIGDTDVLFCSDSGIRSLRVRDSSGNLTPADLGTPIDSLIQARLLSVGVTQMASIVEPISNRYWLAIGNLIYVFSYFPSSGITAWSTYTPQTDAFLAALNPDLSSGNAVYTLVVGTLYYYTKGTGNTTFTNGAQVLTASGYFTATSTTATALRIAGPGFTYDTVAASDLVTFTPEKFVERAGQVYVRSTDGKIYLYGGTDNATYDPSVCSFETPWQDARSAATKKLGSGMDAGLEGGWALSLGMDATSGVLKEVYRSDESSFGKGVIPSTMKGEFFKVRGVTTGVEYARFSSFAFHFNSGDSR